MSLGDLLFAAQPYWLLSTLIHHATHIAYFVSTVEPILEVTEDHSVIICTESLIILSSLYVVMYQFFGVPLRYDHFIGADLLSLYFLTCTLT